MADVNFSLVQAALRTGTGTQDFTVPGFGDPKAAIFFFTAATTTDTVTADNLLGIGFTDGTTDGAWGIYDEDAVTTTVNENSSVAILLKPPGSWDFAQASFSAWTTNGVTINITSDFPSQILCTAVLINGTDVSNVDVGRFTMSGASAVDVTSVGFNPDLVLLTCNGANADAGSNTYGSYGIVHNGSSVTQKGIKFFTASGAGTSAVTLRHMSAGCGGRSNDSIHELSLGTFDASGFTATPSATAFSIPYDYLALKFSNSPDIKLFEMDSPTAAESVATTGVGFQPDFGMIWTSAAQVVDSDRSSSEDGIGITVFDGTNIYSHSVSSDDAVTTTVCKSVTATKLDMLEGGSSHHATATFTSFDADGWTFNYSVAPGTASKWIGLAIGAAAAAGGGLTAGSLSLMGVGLSLSSFAVVIELIMRKLWQTI